MSIKHFGQQILRQNYQITHAYHLMRLWCEGVRTPKKIVIHQMGKVGSTSIWKSLEDLNLNTPIYHIHALSSQGVEKQVLKSKERFSKLHSIYYEISQAEYLRHQLDGHQNSEAWDIITLVRDPIAQTISSFFQALEMKAKTGAESIQLINNDAYNLSLEKIVDSFHEKYVRNSHRAHPFTWFIDEIQQTLKIDVFADKSSKIADYYIYNGDIANVLLLKLESLERSAKVAFQDFLGIQNFELKSANFGSQKRHYGTLYKDFIKNVNLPDHYLNRMYDSPFMKSLYSGAEIETFYQRWSPS
jgi:hypothetical protein